MYYSSLIENFEPNNKSIINIIKLKLNLNIDYLPRCLNLKNIKEYYFIIIKKI